MNVFLLKAIYSVLKDGKGYPAKEIAYMTYSSLKEMRTELPILIEKNFIREENHAGSNYYFSTEQLKDFVLEKQLYFNDVIVRLPRKHKLSTEACHARTCYGHFAGEFGVSMTGALLSQGFLFQENLGKECLVTPMGKRKFSELGIEVNSPTAVLCLDYTERRYHLGGKLGKSLATTLFKERAVVSGENRAVEITEKGESILQEHFGLTFK